MPVAGGLCWLVSGGDYVNLSSPAFTQELEEQTAICRCECFEKLSRPVVHLLCKSYIVGCSGGEFRLPEASIRHGEPNESNIH